MKASNCEKCPCLNSDYEQGASCNLGYKTNYDKFLSDWVQISYDCELKEITYGQSIYHPEYFYLRRNK